MGLTIDLNGFTESVCIVTVECRMDFHVSENDSLVYNSTATYLYAFGSILFSERMIYFFHEKEISSVNDFLFVNVLVSTV